MGTIDNKSDYEKASILMKSALKKYADNDFEGGDKDREEANRLYDLARMYTNKDFNNLALYGENRNFGIVYNVFEKNVGGILKENKKLNVITDFIRLIKSNKVLSEQFNVYNTLCNKFIDSDIDEYLNEALTVIPKFTKQELIENNSKLIDVLRKNNINEFIDIDEKKLSLYESIEFLLLNKKTINNIETYNDHKKIIKENINNNVTDKVSLTENDYNTELQNIIEKNISELNEDEMQLLSELCNENKETVFNRYKDETLQFISEQITGAENLEEKIDWNNIMNKINSKKYNENTVLEDITSFINIQNIIEE